MSARKPLTQEFARDDLVCAASWHQCSPHSCIATPQIRSSSSPTSSFAAARIRNPSSFIAECHHPFNKSNWLFPHLLARLRVCSEAVWWDLPFLYNVSILLCPPAQGWTVTFSGENYTNATMICNSAGIWREVFIYCMMSSDMYTQVVYDKV